MNVNQDVINVIFYGFGFAIAIYYTGKLVGGIVNAIKPLFSKLGK